MTPRVGFGTFNVVDTREDVPANAGPVAEVVAAAIDAGYRLLDTAQMYRNERGVGLAVAQSGLPRRDLVITTKLGNAFHRPSDVRPALEASLERLGLTQVDLFLMHWPLPTLYDGNYVSTWEAMAAAKEAGLAAGIGVSNFEPAHLERIIVESGRTPLVNQVEVHPYFRNTDVVQACDRHGITVQAWSPLGQGEVLSDPVLVDLARQYGRSAAQIVLRWHLQQGRVAIPKSASPTRMRENLDIFDFVLRNVDLAAIDALDRGPSGRRGPHPDSFDWIPRAERSKR
jgi:2,5-diketo-D-gluconate reductase A